MKRFSLDMNIWIINMYPTLTSTTLLNICRPIKWSLKPLCTKSRIKFLTLLHQHNHHPCVHSQGLISEQTYVWVGGNQSESLRDLFSSGATTDIQEVGWGTAVKLDYVHGGHCQTCTIHWRNKQGNFMRIFYKPAPLYGERNKNRQQQQCVIIAVVYWP